jgi:hypothetical protein
LSTFQNTKNPLPPQEINFKIQIDNMNYIIRGQSFTLIEKLLSDFIETLFSAIYSVKILNARFSRFRLFFFPRKHDMKMARINLKKCLYDLSEMVII